jgi:hypothetical protein
VGAVVSGGVLGAVCGVVSVFGVLLSCGDAVELPAAPPDDVVELGVLPVSVGSGVGAGVWSGVVALGVRGSGLVLLPPEGVCSLMGVVLCGWVVGSCAELLLEFDCATAKPVDSSASAAMYMSFFIFLLPGELVSGIGD